MIAGVVLGAVFGFLLAWTRFIEFDVIVTALKLENFYLWFLFASATATGFVGLRVLKAYGKGIHWETGRPTREEWIGGVLFGIGWAVTGTCPGPAIAQIGVGHWAGLFTLAGLAAGIAVRDRSV